MNKLAEFCDFTNKEEFLKYKLFLAARGEPYFTAKLSDFDYHGSTVGDLLAVLSNLEAAYQEQKVEVIHKIKEKCKVCGKGNHSDKDCRLRDASCFKCGKPGHVASVCRNKFNHHREKLPEKDHPLSGMKKGVRSQGNSGGPTPKQKMTHEVAVTSQESTDEESHELNCVTIKYNLMS